MISQAARILSIMDKYIPEAERGQYCPIEAQELCKSCKQATCPADSVVGNVEVRRLLRKFEVPLVWQATNRHSRVAGRARELRHNDSSRRRLCEYP